MPDDTGRFSLDELCALADTPRRTVRYYIQEGLVGRPEGAKRGAYYTRDHLERLLAIRKWQRAGLALERIRELVAEPGKGADLPPERPRRSGDITVRSHIMLRRGVELVVEPHEAGLAPEEVRALARQVAAIVDALKKDPSR
jgi:DNA-binding transcriptional MerR regulator